MLEELLEKYAEHGDAQFVLPDVLQVPPISEHGTVGEIIRLFGGAEQLREAVNELQGLSLCRVSNSHDSKRRAAHDRAGAREPAQVRARHHAQGQGAQRRPRPPAAAHLDHVPQVPRRPGEQREEEATLAGKKFRPAIEPPYRWRDWAANPQGITGDELARLHQPGRGTAPGRHARPRPVRLSARVSPARTATIAAT